MRTRTTRSAIALVAVLGLTVASCGSDEATSTEETAGTTEIVSGTDAPTSTDAAPPTASTQTTEPASDVDMPTIVVTTNILGDVVSEVVGDAAEVITIMPVGADPHNFQASAQEVDTLMNADALIVNGAGFEEGLLDVIDNAVGEGIATFEAISVVDTIEYGAGGHDHDHAEGEAHDHDHGSEGEAHDHDHSSEGEAHDHDHESEGDSHDHAAEGEDHDHEHSGTDPHFFTDPMRMAAAVEGIVDFLQAEVEFADPAALDASADAYVAELTALDAEVAASVDAIPVERRVLVTNHEVFGYFADRYGFEIVGAVIPGGGTADSVSAGELAELAETIAAEGVPAIFADTSSPDELVQTLAAEVGDIAVVQLYSESLGEPGSDGGTYLDMVRTNGERISAALA
jgi:zinc/manganese transport system substrate-binding protein